MAHYRVKQAKHRKMVNDQKTARKEKANRIKEVWDHNRQHEQKNGFDLGSSGNTNLQGHSIPQ